MWELKMHIMVGVGGSLGLTQPQRHRERWFFENGVRMGRWESIYDDFSFLALGESAPWEFTPFTPLTTNKNETQPS